MFAGFRKISYLCNVFQTTSRTGRPDGISDPRRRFKTAEETVPCGGKEASERESGSIGMR